LHAKLDFWVGELVGPLIIVVLIVLKLAIGGRLVARFPVLVEVLLEAGRWLVVGLPVKVAVLTGVVGAT
jgi:hypothetical protein